MVLLLYNLLFPIVFLCMLPGFLFRMVRRGKYRHRFGQRFGVYSGPVRRRLAGKRPVWVHAVSVGEVQVAMRVIDAWRARDPGMEFVLSTTTSTGFALARERCGERVEPMYNPLDFLPTVLAAVSTIRPRMLVLVEAEVWPNLVGILHRRGVPVCLVNARLSPRSECRYLRYRWLVAPVFRKLEFIGVQSERDAGVWRAIGVSPERVAVTGGIKYDVSGGDSELTGEVRAIAGELTCSGTCRVLLGGSTHPGEERLLARVFSRLRKRFPDLKLLLAPRHVERADSVVADLRALGVSLVRRTEWNRDGADAGRVDCLLVDTTGELRMWYATADVVVVGKSLLGRGGQNPVEPLMAGRPVVVGPHMGNFQTLMEELLSAGGVAQTQDATAEELEEAVAELLENPEAGRRMVVGAKAALHAHEGATARTVDALAGRLPTPSP